MYPARTLSQQKKRNDRREVSACKFLKNVTYLKKERESCVCCERKEFEIFVSCVMRGRDLAESSKKKRKKAAGKKESKKSTKKQKSKKKRVKKDKRETREFFFKDTSASSSSFFALLSLEKIHRFERRL